MTLASSNQYSPSLELEQLTSAQPEDGQPRPMRLATAMHSLPDEQQSLDFDDDSAHLQLGGPSPFLCKATKVNSLRAQVNRATSAATDSALIV
jgi:hypothetical protein